MTTEEGKGVRGGKEKNTANPWPKKRERYVTPGQKSKHIGSEGEDAGFSRGGPGDPADGSKKKGGHGGGGGSKPTKVWGDPE